MDLLNVQKEVVIPLFAVRIICSIALYPYASIFEPLIQIIRGIMIFATGAVNVGTKNGVNDDKRSRRVVVCINLASTDTLRPRTIRGKTEQCLGNYSES